MAQANVIRLRHRIPAAILISHPQFYRVGPVCCIHVNRVGRGGSVPVAKIPQPGYLHKRGGAQVAEGDRLGRAAHPLIRHKINGWHLEHANGLGVGVGTAVVVGHGQGHGVKSRCVVHIGRIRQNRTAAISEVPGPVYDVPGSVGAGTVEGNCQRVATGSRCSGEGGRRRDIDANKGVLRDGVAAGDTVGHNQGHCVGAGSAVHMAGVLCVAQRRSVAKIPDPVHHREITR